MGCFDQFFFLQVNLQISVAVDVDPLSVNPDRGFLTTVCASLLLRFCHKNNLLKGDFKKGIVVYYQRDRLMVRNAH